MAVGNYDPLLIELLAVGIFTGDDLRTWAVYALEIGYDSPSLRILAGLFSPTWLSEAKPYFDRAIAELGITIPDDEGLLREYLKVVAQKIVEEEISPGIGTGLIYSRVLTPLGHPEDLRGWYFLWEGLDPQTYEMPSENDLNLKIKRYAGDCLKTCT